LHFDSTVVDAGETSTVPGALRFAEARERWPLGYGWRQKNLNRRAIEESPLRLTIGLPLESEAEATRGLRKAECPLCGPTGANLRAADVT
jgi:hypothetical protein